MQQMRNTACVFMQRHYVMSKVKQLIRSNNCARGAYSWSINQQVRLDCSGEEAWTNSTRRVTIEALNQSVSASHMVARGNRLRPTKMEEVALRDITVHSEENCLRHPTIRFLYQNVDTCLREYLISKRGVNFP